jgi:hypothetical protein
VLAVPSLADSRDKKAAGEMFAALRRSGTHESLVSTSTHAPEADPSTEEIGTWHYLLVDQAGARLRKIPAYTSNSKSSMDRISEGTLVEVSRRRTAGMTRWLFTSQGGGWLFDISPRDSKVRAMEVEVSRGEWAYKALAKVPVLRKPSLFLAAQNRFGNGSVEVEEVISVNKRVRPLNGKGQGCLLQISDGRGWVIDFRKGVKKFEQCTAEEMEARAALESAAELAEAGQSEFAMTGNSDFTNTCNSGLTNLTRCSTVSSLTTSTTNVTMQTGRWTMPTDNASEAGLSTMGPLGKSTLGDWTFVVIDPKGISLRSTPTISQSAKIKSKRIVEGELVQVVERRDTPCGSLLRLKDPPGWAFDMRAGRAGERKLRMQEVSVEHGLWCYRVCTANGIALRSGCAFSDASKVGVGPREGALLTVCQRVQVNETAFLKMQDNSGWVFDRKGKKPILEGPLRLDKDVEGRSATVIAPGGCFLFQHPTKKSWARTQRLLLENARVRLGQRSTLEGLSWVQVSQPGKTDGWLPMEVLRIDPEDVDKTSFVSHAHRSGSQSHMVAGEEYDAGSASTTASSR